MGGGRRSNPPSWATRSSYYAVTVVGWRQPRERRRLPGQIWARKGRCAGARRRERDGAGAMQGGCGATRGQTFQSRPPVDGLKSPGAGQRGSFHGSGEKRYGKGSSLMMDGGLCVPFTELTRNSAQHSPKLLKQDRWTCPLMSWCSLQCRPKRKCE
eukprot:364612-Chlamydomonas_euryale.AAC.17